ncbi:pantothenate kinase [Thermococcus sp. P6]|uniref:pantoate kinase n=1 Tax=Thermococcus sp. P6 TaxID=122420 RepID=UPI000B598A5D|nr:pantoate kinase [Thermococcus sp. P6]ASJ10563.1 pantothenate kinase [Thermococcus sp. P6]
MLIKAFVPSHITAFFVPRFHEDPLKAGSLGAGLNLDKGTTVLLNVEEGPERHVYVAFNGEPVKKEEARISYSVAEELLPGDFMGEVEVWQYFDFPNGYGFGNSGAGALGTALALSHAFKNKTVLQAAQIAHKHEVLNKGGLGDVIAQLAGGIEVRIKEGAPGVGVADNLFFDDYRVLVVPLGRLSTKKILDSEVVRAIELHGRPALERLLREPTPERMMALAREFAEKTGLLSGELLDIARELDGILRNPASMIMLGRGLFALVRDDEVERAKVLLSDMDLPYDVTGIYTRKPEVGRWRG